MDEVTQNFADKKVFENYTVYIVNKNIVAFTIKAKYHEYVKENILKACDVNEFFDIIPHGNKLYILLNAKSNIYDNICDLPSLVKEIEEINKKEAFSASEAMKL